MTATFDDTLGNGFLNDPLDTRLHPIAVLPDDLTLSPFAMEATC